MAITPSPARGARRSGVAPAPAGPRTRVIHHHRETMAGGGDPHQVFDQAQGEGGSGAGVCSPAEGQEGRMAGLCPALRHECVGLRPMLRMPVYQIGADRHGFPGPHKGGAYPVRACHLPPEQPRHRPQL